MYEIQNKIRKVTKDDKSLPMFSYSKLDTYKQCPYRYKMKYVDGKTTDDTTLALELGSLCHYVLEQKGRMLYDNGQGDYEKLHYILQHGTTETDEKTKECLLGINELKKKYYETWYTPDNASDMTYEDKMSIFNDVLKNEMSEGEWLPTYFEYPFIFVYNNRIIIKGFIDRIDINSRGEYRTVDYKTSKKVYDSSKLSTSMQFGIYALAILSDFGTLPVESIYRFILIDAVQHALTKGWEGRLARALDKLIDAIEADEMSKTFVPKPTPLCYWCNYCSQNPQAKEYKRECQYYSLWTPMNKTYEVNAKWAPNVQPTANKRKLIF